jgi:hypothetical protein
MSKGLDIWAKHTANPAAVKAQHDKIAAYTGIRAQAHAMGNRPVSAKELDELATKKTPRLTATHDGGPSLRATAWKATRVANEKNTPEAHDAAAKAHLDVAKAAEEKGKATGNTPGLKGMALEHRDTAGYHQSKASELRGGGGGDDQPRDDHGRFASK